MATHTKLDISDLRPGIILPAAIYDGNNPQLLLLGPGTRITSQNLQRLTDRGVKTFYIDSSVTHALRGQAARKSVRPAAPESKTSSKERDPLLSRISKPAQLAYNPDTTKLIEEKSKRQTEKLGAIYQSFRDSERVQGDLVKSITAESVEDMVIDMDLYLKLAINPKANEPLHQHCMRVSQLAMSMATVLGFTQEDVINLGIGCLISRAGVSDVITDLVLSARKLSEAEMLEIRKVPAKTFSLIESVADIPHIARQVAFQIFERFNGSGYPRGRIGAQIHPMARIASLADVYVALTSPRPYRRSLAPYNAVEMLLEQTQQGLFDPNSLRGLLKTISLFPIGSIVLLSNDVYARVLRNDSEAYDRPTVQAICKMDGTAASETIINLADYDLLRIVRAVDEREIVPFELGLMSTLHRLEAATEVEFDQNEIDWADFEATPVEFSDRETTWS